MRAAIGDAAPEASVAYCLDTCHLYAAGYDISTAEGLDETLQRADEILGLDQVKVLHTNDSKGKLGSRRDLHENIGEGRIGAEAFQRILCHPALRDKPFILETPHDEDGTHRKNAEMLRTLAQ